MFQPYYFPQGLPCVFRTSALASYCCMGLAREHGKGNQLAKAESLRFGVGWAKVLVWLW